MIQEVFNEVKDLLSGNNGEMVYKDLYDATAPEKRQWLPRVLQLGKETGEIRQVVAWDAETKTARHTVVLGGS